jgi:hypothetical protein
MGTVILIGVLADRQLTRYRQRRLAGAPAGRAEPRDYPVQSQAGSK